MHSVKAGITKIGWIGTGVMGSSMLQHLIRAGFTAPFVYTRTPSKAADVVAMGAQLVKSPRAVAEQCDVVFSIVGFPSDVESVWLDSETGALPYMQPGSIAVDMTTSRPSLAKKIGDAANAKAIFALDAPVSGGDIGARNATLTIMCGGDEQAFKEVAPLFAAMSKTSNYMGSHGLGQQTKMTNQILIASAMVGVCEGLLYAQSVGLDPEATIRAVGGGAAGSFSLTAYAPRILKGDYEPGFFVQHFVKDLEIALDECRALNLALPGLALAHQLYVSVKAQGNGLKGTQALYLALKQINAARSE